MFRALFKGVGPAAQHPPHIALTVSNMSNTDLPALGKKKKPGCRMWLRFDIHGNTEVLEVDKYAIMRRASIPARDLRILGPLMSNSSTILGREKAIVLNLEHIKAIITAEEVLLLNANSAAVIPFVEELRRRISLPATSPLREETASPERVNGMQNHDSLPFEFRVMEVALEAVSILESRCILCLFTQQISVESLSELSFFHLSFLSFMILHKNDMSVLRCLCERRTTEFDILYTTQVELLVPKMASVF